MKKFYRIKKDTEEYQTAYNIYHFKKAWRNQEFEKEFWEVIGVPPLNNLLIWPYALSLNTIPVGTRDQFKKNKRPSASGYVFEAKVKTDLNKKFLELVKKYNLEYYEMSFLTIRLGHGYWDCVYPFDEATDFIMETVELSEESIQKVEYGLNCLEEVPAKIFYEMMANKEE